jgi:hypothetical protein
MSAEKWKRIEELAAEIEKLDVSTRGQFRQADDHEAVQILQRIERKMKRELAKNKPK